LQRTKSNLILNRGAEKLYLGVLEEQAHPLAEEGGKGSFPKLLLGQGLSVRPGFSPGRKEKAVEDMKERGLAASIGSHDGQALPCGYPKINRLKRGELAVVSIVHAPKIIEGGGVWIVLSHKKLSQSPKFIIGVCWSVLICVHLRPEKIFSFYLAK
jgi:hypothetical protein